MDSPLTYRFEGFTLDGATKHLRRGDNELSLEPKSFRLLEFLIENRDRVVEKEEIFRVVWNETNVTDNALTRTIAQIRKALDDDPRQPRFIETLPTVGYRFIGKLTAEGPPPSANPLPRKSPRIAVQAVVAFTVLAAIGLAAWRFWPRPSLAAVPMPVPLTTYRGNEEAPSFSPDGSQVVFQWDGEKQDNLDIYVKAMGPDAVPLRLTTNPLPDRMPSWSPDGSTIAFVRVLAPSQGELMLIPALGGPERRLAQIPIWQDLVWDSIGYAPSWSTNGKWLIVPELVEQHTALFRVSVETGEQEQITEPDIEVDDKFPAISPDGKTLLFTRKPTFYVFGSLYTVRLNENAKPVEAPKPGGFQGLLVAGAAWMADRTQVVASTPSGLYSMELQGGGEPQPVAGAGGLEVRGVAISRQGNRLAYAVVHGDPNIWRIDLRAKELKPERLIASTSRDVYPQYSPDGSQIAFESARGGAGAQVWLSDAEGRQARQLTFVNRGLAGSAHWSPDGRVLAMDSNVTGSYQIYTMDSDGGKMKQLTDKFDNFGVTWSRDGGSLYFTSTRTGRTEVWKMPAGGGTAVQVTHNGGQFGRESEDGKTLYFARTLRSDSGSIWKMPIAGGTEQQLADSLYRVNFAVAKRGIYYMTHAGESGNCVVKFYDFATTNTSTVLQMGRPEYGLDISPDGRYLVYAQLDDPASDLMLIENFR